MRRLLARAAILSLILVAAPALGSAQTTAVLTHNSSLRTGPSIHHHLIRIVPKGSVVTLLPHGHVTHYIRVQTQDEDVGWVTAHNVAVVDPTEVQQPVDQPASPLQPAPDLNVVKGAYDGCPVEGNPKPTGTNYKSIEAANELKNRSAEPTDSDIDSEVTLAKMVAPSGDDSQRWSDDEAAEVVGYVIRVIPGGKTETTNCRKSDSVHRDAHIELVISPDQSAETQRVIVEVTPRWRAAAKTQGIDWSIGGLEHALSGHWVKVRGWLFFDAKHSNVAENTNPGGPDDWRATAWEIHPVANLTIVQQP